MAKLVECCKCKYNKSHSTTFQDEDPFWQGKMSQKYDCEANTAVTHTFKETVTARTCPYFRSRSLTAWQEVRYDAFRAILNFTKSGINHFLKK